MFLAFLGPWGHQHWGLEEGHRDPIAGHFLGTTKHYYFLFLILRSVGWEQGSPAWKGRAGASGMVTDELDAIVRAVGMCCCTRGPRLAHLVFHSPP